jgi:Zn-dependent protease with chaperone function
MTKADRYFRVKMFLTLLKYSCVALTSFILIYFATLSMPILQDASIPLLGIMVLDYLGKWIGQISVILGIIFGSYVIISCLFFIIEYRLASSYGVPIDSRQYSLLLKFKLKIPLVIFTIYFLVCFFAFSLPAEYMVAAFAIFIIGYVLLIVFGQRINYWLFGNRRFNDPRFLDGIKNLVKKMGLRGFKSFYKTQEKSKDQNAFQMGNGRNARIYLVGNITEVMTPNEINAVVGHELAHYKQRHLLGIMALCISCFYMFDMIFSALGFLLSSLFSFLGTYVASAINMFVFYVLPFVSSFLFVFFVMRRMEFEADAISAKYNGPIPLITSLKKLAKSNLVPLYYGFWGFLFTHPSMGERIRRLRLGIKSKWSWGIGKQKEVVD